jgi:hypothetical protein
LANLYYHQPLLVEISRSFHATSQQVGLSSETSGLTWADVDFENRRLIVRSAKAEGHEGREDREFPIRPELLRRLQEAFDVEKAVPIGEARICGHTGGWIDEVLKKAIEAAGVKPWADLWRKARSSSEKQLQLEKHRSEAIAGWHGHSEKIAKKHYRTGILDSEFDAVAFPGGRPVQNPVQDAHVSGCTDAHRVAGAAKGDSVSGVGAGTCGPVREDASELQIAATGVEPVADSQVLAENEGVGKATGAKSGAWGAICDAWPSLSSGDRDRVANFVRDLVSRPGQGGGR